MHNLYAVSVMRFCPFLGYFKLLAVDENGIESDGIFGLGKTDSTCWSALSSTLAFKTFQ